MMANHYSYRRKKKKEIKPHPVQINAEVLGFKFIHLVGRRLLLLNVRKSYSTNLGFQLYIQTSTFQEKNAGNFAHTNYILVR